MTDKTLLKYFDIKQDTTYYGSQKIDFDYLELKPIVKGFYKVDNKQLKTEIENRINTENNGLYYKGFYICFTYKNELYCISHHHKSTAFIDDIADILRKYEATDIIVKNGELD